VIHSFKIVLICVGSQNLIIHYSFIPFTESYKKVATRLCALAKESGSRDNISVIVVYLKEPHLIATQSWPSLICESNENMENMNVFDDPAMEKPVQVTMDALGNTNQVSYHSMQSSTIE